MALLTSMAVPLARYKVRRERERELRYALREIRTAIDKYKDMADGGKLGSQKIDTEGYPESLDVLVEGVKQAGSVDKKIRFLRKIPRDPFHQHRRLGQAQRSGRPEGHDMGRPERVRRVYEIDREGSRWHSVLRVVTQDSGRQVAASRSSS